MGAYGHSKWREIVLGGATRSRLSNPLLPIPFRSRTDDRPGPQG
jgi:hypothetical protein